MLSNYAGRSDVIVLGLPRGGVPVAFEVAQALGAPFDVFVVRKLGVPGQQELAMGAIASGGGRVLNQDIIASFAISPGALEAVIASETKELARRELAYRGERAVPDLEGRTVIIVDDGVATGSTMRAAADALRRRRPARIVVAIPVGPPQVHEDLEDVADEVVCVRTPAPFFGVGRWYESFPQTDDDEVRELLTRAALRR
jgi:putative phosphoribosyl transferase